MSDLRIADLKLQVIDAIGRSKRKQMSFLEIAEKLAIYDKKTRLMLTQVVEKLLKDSALIETMPGQYSVANFEESFSGVVDMANNRFGFIKTDDFEEDVYVTNEDFKGALDGDEVRFIITWFKKGKKPEGLVVEVLKRARTSFVGLFQLKGKYAWVKTDARRMFEEILIKQEDFNSAQEGEKVLVEVLDFGDGSRAIQGKVTRVLGPAGENEVEIHSIMTEFGLPLEFSAAVEAEAEAIPTEISESEIKKRKDFRGITTFTIDPFDAKDFDDALSIQFLPNKNIEVGVHIADVTHYIQPETLLEEEALARATSTYLVDRVSPMLPERLSNFLCSLRPHEDKLTFSAVFELNEKAEIQKEWFGRTIIHSDRRFTYEEVQEVIETQSGEFSTEILELNRLAGHLRGRKFKEGAIAFETPEVKFQLDEKGVPLAVIPKVRKDAHKLIEDFMLLANKRVAEFVFNFKKKTSQDKNVMVYRVHENPDQEKLKTLSFYASKFGYKILTGESQLAESLNNMANDLVGKPEQDILQDLAVRCMAKARYTTKELGHYGLAFAHYTHFTSPIRRYPDMMVHRLLQIYLDGKNIELDPDAYEKLCKHSSEKEKKASDAERASIKFKQVEYMALQDASRVYDGIISGLTEWGIYVEILENKCEGLIRMTELQDDFYEYDKESLCLRGRRTGRTLFFGDRLQVKVKGTDIEKRTIDLVPLKGMFLPMAKDDSFRRDKHRGREGDRGRRNKNQKGRR